MLRFFEKLAGFILNAVFGFLTFIYRSDIDACNVRKLLHPAPGMFIGILVVIASGAAWSFARMSLGVYFSTVSSSACLSQQHNTSSTSGCSLDAIALTDAATLWCLAERLETFVLQTLVRSGHCDVIGDGGGVTSVWWLLGVLVGGALAGSVVLYGYVGAVIVQPGYVTRGYMPASLEERQRLDWCCMCDGYRPLRSHHCSTCGRCVKRMDHHCVLINNCIGYDNLTLLIAALLASQIGSLLAITILGFHLRLVEGSELRDVLSWVSWLISSLQPPPHTLTEALVPYLWQTVSLALSTCVFVGAWLPVYLLLSDVHRNVTSLERLMLDGFVSELKQLSLERHDRRRVKYLLKSMGVDDDVSACDDVIGRVAFDMGTWHNWSSTLVPWCRGDGLHWTHRPNSDPGLAQRISLFRRSLMYKHSVICRVVADYNATSWIFTEGWRSMCSLTAFRGAKMSVRVGEQVSILKLDDRWLFGERVRSCGDNDMAAAVRDGRRPLGWFPVRCVRSGDLTAWGHTRTQPRRQRGARR